MRYDIRTCYEDGVIIQDVYDTHDDAYDAFISRVVYAMDDQMRAILVAAGWTPPKDR